MANVVTGMVWEIDTEGVIFDRPVWIQKAVLIPHAVDDFATFSCWGAESNNATARTTMLQKTITVTSTNILTSTANDFEAAEVVVQDIIQITGTETDNNLGYWQVNTRGGDDNITVDIGVGAWGTTAGALTNEASKLYDWKIWDETTVIRMSTNDANTYTEINFTGMGHRGRRFPNLSCASLDTSTKVILYIA